MANEPKTIGAMMINLRSCPKSCLGNLILREDMWGWYKQRIQCDYIDEMVPVTAKENFAKQPAYVATWAVVFSILAAMFLTIAVG